MRHARALSVLCTLLLAGATVAAPPEEVTDAWPREVVHEGVKVVVYQPQLDSYEGNILKGRCAVSVTPAKAKDPIFGAIWFSSVPEIDRAERIVSFTFKVTKVRFPDATQDQQDRLAKLLETYVPQWVNGMSYDAFLPLVAAVEEKQAGADLKHDPPVILFETAPAMLLIYDGEPQLRKVEGSALERIINTPAVVVKEASTGRFYLYGGTAWLEAPDAMGPFAVAGAVPQDVKTLGDTLRKGAEEKARSSGEVLPQDDEKVLIEQAKKENPKFDPSKPPKIIPVTKPTELIVFDGEPKYAPLGEASEVLHVENTASTVLLDVASKSHYVLLSGRWYAAPALDKSFEFVPPGKLPKSFGKIPEDSPKGDVLASVPGTPQADEAVADAQIPQVAAVKRGVKHIEVKYEGSPKFDKIPETSLERAINTSSQVLRAGEEYYLCEQGVWYVSAKPLGPWQVADKIPPDVQKIPASSPAYNTKYVYIYDSTPEVVYVGYTPAYLGVYPYYGTVVWGTGYPYTPWVGAVYYPPPVAATWGFHAHYNPYTGWSMGVSVGWSWGWGSITIGWSNWGGYPCWGPGGYYPVYRPPYYPGYRPPYYPGYGPRPTPYRPGAPTAGQLPAGSRPSAGQLPAGGAPSAGQLPAGGAPSEGQLPAGGGGARPAQQPAGGGAPSAAQQPASGRASNLYKRPENAGNVASTTDRAAGANRASPRPSGGSAKNNVFADQAGNVYRANDKGGFDQRVGNQWKPSAGSGGSGAATRPSTGGSSGSRATQTPSTVQRDYSARQRSAQRSSYGSYGGSRGGMRGGGGGRRR